MTAGLGAVQRARLVTTVLLDQGRPGLWHASFCTRSRTPSSADPTLAHVPPLVARGALDDALQLCVSRGPYARVVSTSATRRPSAKILVTDLDNTLWDWVDVWYKSFSAMLDKLIDVSGVPRATLEREIRQVHQKYGTAEYSFLLDELPSIQVARSDGTVSVRDLDAVRHEWHSKRYHNMRLYPEVRETLEWLRGAGVPVVAYTESLSYWTEWRVRRTDLDGVLDALYSSPDHDFPAGVALSDFRTLTPDNYGLQSTAHRHVPRGILKPNTVGLNQILADFGVAPSESVYVGDNLMKDVAMAKAAGAMDVHARYGQAHERPEYGLLRRVSHWPHADIEREKMDTVAQVQPTRVLKSRFSEILDLFDFRAR